MNNLPFMVMRRLCLLVSVIFGFSCAFAEQQNPSLQVETVSDPIQDFLTTRFRKPDDSLFVLELDLEGKGQKEMFLSYSHNADGKAGNVWVPYIPVKGGYQRSDQLVTFDVRTLFLGYNKELNITGIITYYSGGGGKGVLIGYTFDGRRFKQSDAKPIEPAGKDAEEFKRIFDASAKYKPKILAPEQLPATTYN